MCKREQNYKVEILYFVYSLFIIELSSSSCCIQVWSLTFHTIPWRVRHTVLIYHRCPWKFISIQPNTHQCRALQLSNIICIIIVCLIGFQECRRPNWWAMDADRRSETSERRTPSRSYQTDWRGYRICHLRQKGKEYKIPWKNVVRNSVICYLGEPFS